MRLVFAALVVVLVLLPCQAEAVPVWGFSIYGPTYPGVVCQFAQAPGGRILAPNLNGSVCGIFLESGAFESNFWISISPPRAFGHATGVALDDSQYVYVADQSSNRVYRFSPSLEWVGYFGSSNGISPGTLTTPTSLAFSPDGSKLYVTEYTTARVTVVDRYGNLLFRFGSFGSAPDQFNHPFGIVVDPLSGDVFITDENNNRVSHWTGDGTFVSSFGSAGTALGQFNIPTGIALDPVSGDLFVGDQLNYRVERFRQDGTPVLEFTRPIQNGSVLQPWGVFVAGDGKIWVSNWNNANLEVFTSDGAVAVPTTSWGAIKAAYR